MKLLQNYNPYNFDFIDTTSIFLQVQIYDSNIENRDTICDKFILSKM